MKKKFLFLAVVAIALSVAGANGQVRQQKRIEQGVRSGEITPVERARISNQKQDVREEIRDAKKDGVITPDERRDIRQEKRQVKRTIHRVENNDRKRK